MEGLGAAASIIAVLQISSSVVEYINTARGAKEEQDALRKEIRRCETILRELKDQNDLTEEGQDWSNTIAVLEDKDGPLGRLWIALKEVEEKLRHGSLKSLGILKWPFKKKDVIELVDAIQREQSLLQLALENNSRRLLQEIKRTSNTNNKQLTTLIEGIQKSSDDTKQLTTLVSQLEKNLGSLQTSTSGLRDELDSLSRRHDQKEQRAERWEILDWLTEENVDAHQDDVLGRRQAGTGQWIFRTPEFEHWLHHKKETLLCTGIQGAGKTILTSILIEELLKRFGDDMETVVAYIYFEYDRQNEQTPPALLASLLRQLARHPSHIPDCVKLLYERHRHKKTRATYEEIIKTLHTITKQYDRVFIVLDALDECQTAGGQRDRFLREMRLFQAQCGVNLFVTTRHMANIEKGFKGSIRLEIRASKHDMGLFLDENIFRLPDFVESDANLQEEVKSSIIDAAAGMFMLATLHLEGLVGEQSPKALRVALTKLPTGTDAYAFAYSDAMKRVERQLHNQKRLAKRVISWITRATRQLTVTELQHALAVEKGETELDEDNLTDVTQMVSYCAGLVTVDKESNIIRLAHYTTQEYLVQTWREWFPEAEFDITTACCTYLSFDLFGSELYATMNYRQIFRENPLLKYAAQNWGRHALNAETYCEQVIQFLRSDRHAEASGEILFAEQECGEFDWPYTHFPGRIRGAHQAAFFGVDYAIKEFLPESADLKDGFHRTPLFYAALSGHDEIVRLLIETDNADINISDIKGLTPLAWAARNGHVAVISTLLKADAVNPDAKDAIGKTPLAWAADHNHPAAVKILLARDDVDANSRTIAQLNEEDRWEGDTYASRTPLSWAADSGNDEIVKLLLDTGRVEVDVKDGAGLTPLSYAARKGHSTVVGLLLATGKTEVDSEATTGEDKGRTPLSFAAEKGFASILQQLLDTGKVNPDSIDYEGRTPLSFVAEKGSASIAQQLLDTDKVDPDSINHKGRTPLSFASEVGSLSIVKQLLDTGRVNPDSNDHEGRTPLSFAAEKGHREAVQLLLETGKVQIDSKGGDMKSMGGGMTPLLWAISGERHPHEGVIKLLIDNGAGINSVNKHGQTPLSQAARERNENVVRELLKYGAEVDRGSKSGQTPLSRTIGPGFGAITRLLLEAGAEVDFRDSKGRTPLSRAWGNAREAVEELLKNGAHVESKDNAGRTPLSHATEDDEEIVVELLLKAGADVESRDNEGRTPLSHATHEGIKCARKLLEHGAQVDSKDNSGRTPLSYAAGKSDGFWEVYEASPLVELLLANGAEVDSKDKYGRTPLSYAVSDDECITDFSIGALLAGKADINCKDNERKTPLSRAEESGTSYLLLPATS